MLTPLDHLRTSAGSILKMQRGILRERGWKAEDWYRAWQSTDLPREVEAAVREYFGE